MRLAMKILGVLLVLALLYFIGAGLGITKKLKHRKAVVKSLMITDFEYLDYDFDWNTGGYVKIEPSTENQTHGKRSAKATFLLASQFYPTPVSEVSNQSSEPTPEVINQPSPVPSPGKASQFSPTPTPEESHAVSPKPTPEVLWAPQMSLDTTSPTQLQVYEWVGYADFDMDVFNDQTSPVTYHIQVADAHAYRFEHSGILTPKKVTNISVPLDDMVKERLDMTNIRSLKFWVDTNSAKEPVVVYLDNIRLEGEQIGRAHV
jgi:hypothetical protein